MINLIFEVTITNLLAKAFIRGTHILIFELFMFLFMILIHDDMENLNPTYP